MEVHVTQLVDCPVGGTTHFWPGDRPKICGACGGHGTIVWQRTFWFGEFFRNCAQGGALAHAYNNGRRHADSEWERRVNNWAWKP
jgi:DnaJ-class molecular chaperone